MSLQEIVKVLKEIRTEMAVVNERLSDLEGSIPTSMIDPDDFEQLMSVLRSIDQALWELARK